MADGFLEPDSVPHEQRLSSAGVAQIGDALAVFAPYGVGLADSRRCRQITHRAVLHRNTEYVAARGDQHAFTRWRQARGGDVLGRVLPLRTCLDRLQFKTDGYGMRLAAGNIQGLQLAGHLVDDAVLVRPGVAHVPLRLMGKLPDRVRGCLIEEKIRGTVVAVRYECHIVADPHGIAIGGIHMRDFLHLVAGGVDNPDWRSIAAPMLAPTAAARVGHDVRTICQAFTVRRPGALDGDGLHHLLLIAAGKRYLVKLTTAAVCSLAGRHEQHPFAIGTPAGYQVRGRMPRKPPGLPTLGRNYVYVGIVVIGRRKCDPLTIWREMRRELGSRVSGDARRPTAVAVADPDVAAENKRDAVFGYRRLAQ
jgi:hypothetical protein